MKKNGNQQQYQGEDDDNNNHKDIFYSIKHVRFERINNIMQRKRPSQQQTVQYTCFSQTVNNILFLGNNKECQQQGRSHHQHQR